MVEWKKLGEVCAFNRGKTITAKDAVDGDIPVIAGGQTPSYYHNEFNREGESITVAGSGAYAGFVSYWNQPIFVSDAFTIDPLKGLKHKYLFHWAKMNQEKIIATQKGAGVPHVHGKDIANFLIPIPSLSEQSRIVSILDTFTSSISNLKQQIEERRKQYEYERDLLLDLEGKEGVEMKKLGEIGDVTKLAGFEFTEHVTYQEDGKIIALRGLNVRDGHLDLNQVKYIDGSNFAKLSRSKLVINDMLFTYVGTIGNVALIDENEKYYLAPNVSRIRFDESIINPKYALYIFMSQSFHRTQINKFLNSSSMKNLSMENIRKFILPIPPLSTQSRIVSILDTFEQSISNLEEQLAMREKQYEYYRNQLLTFEGEEERGKT